jgi:hypothetical protein
VGLSDERLRKITAAALEFHDTIDDTVQFQQAARWMTPNRMA